MNWIEDLPKSCPPLDSIKPNGFVGYRLLRKNKVRDADFRGKQERSSVDLCILKGVSVFESLEQVKRVSKMPTLKNNGPIVAKIKLYEQDGKIKKTYGKGHYTWWRSTNFDLDSVEIVCS